MSLPGGCCRLLTVRQTGWPREGQAAPLLLYERSEARGRDALAIGGCRLCGSPHSQRGRRGGSDPSSMPFTVLKRLAGVQ